MIAKETGLARVWSRVWGGLGGGFWLGFFRFRGWGCFGVNGFSVLLGTHPCSFIESRVFGRRGGGFVLGASIRNQAFDGDDHRDCLDLGGHAVAGLLWRRS